MTKGRVKYTGVCTSCWAEYTVMLILNTKRIKKHINGVCCNCDNTVDLVTEEVD